MQGKAKTGNAVDGYRELSSVLSYVRNVRDDVKDVKILGACCHVRVEVEEERRWRKKGGGESRSWIWTFELVGFILRARHPCVCCS